MELSRRALTTSIRAGLGLIVTLLALVVATGTALASPYPISQISAIPAADATALKAAGVETTDQLLEKAATPKARAALAKQTKIKANTLFKWAKMADLMRIPNVGPEAVNLLAAAKVDTVKALLRQKPDKLAEAIRKINEKKKLTEKPPTVESLSAWQQAAKSLPAVLK